MSDENGMAPHPMTFPQVQVNVNPQGMTVSVILAPGVVLSTLIAEEQMNQITSMWIQTRKDIQDQMRVIEQVRRSKIN